VVEFPVVGAVVAWWEGNALTFGTITALDKQRVRLALAGGGEERILPARLAFELARTAAPIDRVEGSRRARERESAVGSLAARVDTALLWELAHEKPGPADLGELAELALGAAGASERAALCVAFARDGLHFKRSGADWEPREASQVASLTQQRERESARASERKAFVDALTAAVRSGAFSPSGSEVERRGLEALEQLAVHDLAASEAPRAAALALLEAVPIAGDRPAERAFRLLRRVGVFASDDENLHVRRLGLAPHFPDKVEAAARAAVLRGFSRAGRADLTHLPVVTIDGASTRDLDDALSFEPGGTLGRIGIHIADPAVFVAPGDPVDVEALSRATSHYLPDVRIPMLPRVLSEEAASLVEGEPRPALSFFVELASDGEWTGSSIARSVIRSRARLDYAAADAVLATGEAPFGALLRGLDEAAQALARRRAARGGVLLDTAEVNVRREADGTISLERIEPGSRARRLVTEAMVLAGELAARFCLDHALPSIYRRQPPPAAPIDVPLGSESDPVVVRAARMRLRRAEVSAQPGPHFALGLEAYSQASSPLRRFQDLAVHRQIAAHLEGLTLPYGPAEIQTIAATTERAEQAARDAERQAERYWLLRYLEQSGATEVEAIVVDTEPPVVELLATRLEERVPSLAGATPGERVTLTIGKINPRADLLVLRPR